MFDLVKKDFLTLSKSRSDLFELLLMPFLLISILGFALGGLLFGGEGLDVVPVALVVEEEEAVELEHFEDYLRSEEYAEEWIQPMLSAAEGLDVTELFQSTIASEDLEEVVDVQEMSLEEAEEALEEEEIPGIYIIPEGFRVDAWRAAIVEEESTATIELTVLDEGAIQSDVLESISQSFVRQFNLEMAIARSQEVEEEETADVEDPETTYGENVYLSNEEPISAFQYYTIGMGIMFSLSLAPAMSSRAFLEKKQHVFGRIMLSNTKPMTYLMSKMISATLISMVQLALLFGLSTLVFDTFAGRSIEFWGVVGMVTVIYALFVGSMTSLLTSFALYADSDEGSGIFSMLVSVLAFFGGSFTPIEQFGETFRVIVGWVPNGAALLSYLQVLQGFALSEVQTLLLRIVLFTAIAFIVAVGLFPKRRLD